MYLKILALVANSSKTGEETLQTEKIECNSHLGIGSTVLSGLRETRRYIGVDLPALEAITLTYLLSSRLA